MKLVLAISLGILLLPVKLLGMFVGFCVAHFLVGYDTYKDFAKWVDSK